MADYLVPVTSARRTSRRIGDKDGLAIANFSGCGYCIAAHSMIADKMSGVPAESLAARRGGRPLPDPNLLALRAFTCEWSRAERLQQPQHHPAGIRAGPP